MQPDDYLPARMINEFVYCPRLFYLMHIEGQFADSIDTIDGQIVHRRVDDGTGRLDPAVAIPKEDDELGLPPATPAKPTANHSSAAAKRKAAALQTPSFFDSLPDADEPVTPVIADHTSDPGPHPRSLDAADATDETPPAEPAARTIHARSVTLSSDSIGVIAKLDLAEATGNQVTPVDYKRGRPRQELDGSLGAWKPERVQIALQALVLRDNGYQVDQGVLYFNETRQRVTVPITEELVASTRLAIEGAKQLVATPVIPPPLIASPKCPRCSMVAICLPDETRRLQSYTAHLAATTQGSSTATGNERSLSDSDAPDNVAASRLNGDDAELPSDIDGEFTVRPMVTSRDERRPLYLNTQGTRLGREGDVLQVRGDGVVSQEIRLRELNQINLFGNVQLTTQAIQAMIGAGIPLLYFTQRGWFYGMTSPLGLKNVQMRREQFRAADDPKFCLWLAKQLVAGKIRNCRTLLMRNHREPPAETLRDLKRLASQTMRADSLASLLGVEGTAARIYFQQFAGMIKVDCRLPNGGAEPETASPTFDFRGRNRRPPRDPVNALLSLAYSLLTKDCTVAAAGVGLDPHLGFYHQVKPGKPALSLDLMEPMRPLIADSVVISAINNRMVTGDHFIRAGQSVVLSDIGRKHFFHAYEQRMDSLVTHPLFGYRVSYRRLLEIQTRLLGRLLVREISDYPVFTTR